MQGSGRQVSLRCLCERLGFSHGSSNHWELQLLEGCRDLGSEGSRCDVTSNNSGSGGSSKLPHNSLASILEDLTLTSARFSRARVVGAASRNFSQFLFRFMMLMPSLFLLKCTVPFESQGWCHLSQSLLQ